MHDHFRFNDNSPTTKAGMERSAMTEHNTTVIPLRFIPAFVRLSANLLTLFDDPHDRLPLEN